MSLLCDHHWDVHNHFCVRCGSLYARPAPLEPRTLTPPPPCPDPEGHEWSAMVFINNDMGRPPRRMCCRCGVFKPEITVVR